MTAGVTPILGTSFLAVRQRKIGWASDLPLLPMGHARFLSLEARGAGDGAGDWADVPDQQREGRTGHLGEEGSVPKLYGGKYFYINSNCLREFQKEC